MAEQSIRAWAEERKLPYELLLKALIDAGWDESRDQISDEEKKRYLKTVVKAIVDARKGGATLASPQPVPPVQAPTPTPDVLPDQPATDRKPSAISPEITQLQRAREAAEKRERRQREEEAVRARAEAEQRTLETARKLEQEQKTSEPVQPEALSGRGRSGGPGRGRQAAPSKSTGRRRRRQHERPASERPLSGSRKDMSALRQDSDELDAPFQARDIEVPEFIQINDLAHLMSVKASVVLKALMELGVVATATQVIDQDTAVLAVSEIGHNPIAVLDRAAEDKLEQYLTNDAEPVARPPVVTVMGHVDHGKTSLLDCIRKTKVTEGEAGGITQHIGAYQVSTDKGTLTFIDTPGHAAFTALRARGAQATDMVVLVVAADDGVMPQTEEAIEHARAADVPLVVAINKMDRPRANPDQVRQQLGGLGVQVEGFGGDVQAVEVSAQTGDGTDKLLEALLLEAEVRELKSPPTGPARGVVLEATMTTGRGPSATLLVQSGKLKVGDIILAGDQEVKVRAMTGDTGERLKEAGPSVPIEILGFDSVPEVGQPFATVADARLRREVLEYRTRVRDSRKSLKDKVGLEALFDSQEKNRLNLVIKADVRGSLEAIRDSLGRLGNDKAKVDVVSGGIGAIGESDISLAHAVGNLVVGFNVRADAPARKAARELNVDIRYYSTIYALIEDMENALLGLVEPEMHEEIIGTAEVKEVFHSSSFGLIAGSVVEQGQIQRDKPVRVLRDNIVIFEGDLSSLRHYKEDVGEVKEGTECGIGIKNYKDIRVGDRIEVFSVRALAPTLEKRA